MVKYQKQFFNWNLMCVLILFIYCGHLFHWTEQIHVTLTSCCVWHMINETNKLKVLDWCSVFTMQPTATTKCQMTKTTLHYDYDNHSVPDCGLWKSHLQLLNWKHLPAIQKWETGILKRQRDNRRGDWMEWETRKHRKSGSKKSQQSLLDLQLKRVKGEITHFVQLQWQDIKMSKQCTPNYISRASWECYCLYDKYVSRIWVIVGAFDLRLHQELMHWCQYLKKKCI